MVSTRNKRYVIRYTMEELIVKNMKLNEEITKIFSTEELDNFLDILSSNDSDVKRQERFSQFIKGEEE